MIAVGKSHFEIRICAVKFKGHFRRCSAEFIILSRYTSTSVIEARGV